MTTRQDIFNLYNYSVEKVENDLARNLLTEDEADYLRQALFNENQEILAEFEGVAIADEEILAGNEFGQALIDFADNYELDLQDLSEILGAEPELIEELIVSDEVPEDDIIDEVSEILEYAESGEDEVEEEYEEDEEDEEVEDEETEEAPYRANYRNTANFSNYQARKVQQLENKLAEMEREKEIIAAFSERQRFGAELVNNGDMPPAVYQYLFGSLDGSDNLATFSESCQELQVDVVSRFHALDTVLDVFSRMGLGESGLFMSFSEQVETAEFQSEDKAAEQQALNNFRGYLKNKDN